MWGRLTRRCYRAELRSTARYTGFQIKHMYVQEPFTLRVI
jgi:hypothetical protein